MNKHNKFIAHGIYYDYFFIFNFKKKKKKKTPYSGLESDKTGIEIFYSFYFRF